MGGPLTMFERGDPVKVRWRGDELKGRWLFQNYRDGLVSVRREGFASPRMFDASEVEVIDADARWSA